MIRVIHVINSLGMGGAQRLLYDLVNLSNRARLEIEILCLYEGGGFTRPFEGADVPLRVLGLERNVRKPSLFIQFYKELSRLNGDVVHAHLPEACWYSLPTARLAGVPVRIAHLQNCNWYWPGKLRLLDRVALAFATKTLACSDAVRQFYDARIHYPADKIQVVYNPVDLTRFSQLPNQSDARNVLGLPDDAQILVCVASLDEQKGHRYLLDAMRRVVSILPKTVLLLVGDGALRGKLEQDVSESSIASAIRFLGQRADIPLILSSGDIFVLPSLWEGLPMSLLEAGAAGLPTVATNVDGIPEVIQDGTTGLLVPSEESEALADSIITLLKDPERAVEMGKHARRRIMDQFSASKIVHDMELMYEELMQSAKGMK